MGWSLSPPSRHCMHACSPLCSLEVAQGGTESDVLRITRSGTWSYAISCNLHWASKAEELVGWNRACNLMMMDMGRVCIYYIYLAAFKEHFS